MAQLGKYSLIRKIGLGGMGEVWKATAHGPAGFEKTVAIKKILQYRQEDSRFVEMFVAEAKLVAHLVHPNIVQVYDFGMDEGGADERNYYLVMEYVSGQNLAKTRRRLKEVGLRLPVEIALYIAIEAAKSLAFAHSATDSARRPLEIVHRDVSAQNLLLSYTGEVKVTDFGIARVASAMPETIAAQFKGKSSYLSPEQARGEELTASSDIFSLGIVLYEILANKKLFTGTNRAEYVLKISRWKGITEKDVGVRVPPGVLEVLQTALEPKPENRYSNATQMEAELIRVLGTGSLIQARETVGSLLTRLFTDEFEAEAVEPAPVDEITEVSIVSGTDAPDSIATLIRGTRFEPVKELELPDPVPGVPPAQPLDQLGIDDTRVQKPPEETASAATTPAAPGTAAESSAETTPTQNQNEGDFPSPPAVSVARPPDSPATTTTSDMPAPWEDRAPERRTPTRLTWVVHALGYTLILGIGILLGRFLFTAPTIPVADAPVGAGSLTAVASEDASETPVVAAARTPVSTRRVVRRRRTPTSTPEPEPVATTAPPATIASAAPTSVQVVVASTPNGNGRLTVNAVPWAVVYVNGKKLGNTPIRQHELKPGGYRLRLIHPDHRGGTKRIKIEAEKELRVIADLELGTFQIQ